MSTHTFIHASREPGFITAALPSADDCYGGPLRIIIRTGAPSPSLVTIFTGSAALAAEMAKAINGVMSQFAKPAAAELAEEAAE